MAVYGYDFYGVGHYGAVALIDYDARPFAALGIDYGVIQLQWNSPSGAWDRMRITRDSNGYAPRSDMGQLLLDVDVSVAPTSYTDVANLTPGSFYYYSIWVRSTVDGSWRRAADTTGLVVKDWKYSQRLYELVPTHYRDQDDDIAAGTAYADGPLSRFLSIFGYQFDHIRTEFESLLLVNNPDKVAGGLLPLMARQWGFGFEQELGMRLARIQCRNAVHMYKHKGTKLGIEAAVSSLTGWAPVLASGVNLMLDQNDSSFVQGLGRWQRQTNCTVTTKDITIAPTFGAAVPPPSGAGTGNVGSGNNVMQMTATAAGDMSAALAIGTAAPAPPTNYSPATYGVPVSPGMPYAVSSYVYTGATSRSCNLQILWFDIAGNYISTVVGNDYADSAAAWTRVMVGGQAPANAYWMGVVAYVKAAAAGGIHYWDAFQVEQSVNLLSADDASFEATVGHWISGTSGTMGRATGVAGAPDGAAVGTITATAVGISQVSIPPTDYVGIPGLTYSAGVLVRTSVGADRNVQLFLNFYAADGLTVIGTVNGTIVTATAGAWVSAPASGVAPAGTAFVRPVLRQTAAVIGDVLQFDAMIMSATATVQPFSLRHVASAWQSARDIRIYLTADRVNRALNPGFEVNATHWTGIGGVSTTAQSNAYAHSGTYSLAVTASAVGTGRARFSANDHFILPGQMLTGSIYILTPAGARTVRTRLQWWDATGTNFSSVAGPDVVTTNSTTTWTRLSVIGQVVPAGTVNFTLDVQCDGMAIGEIFYIDDALVETGTTLGDFFSGSVYSPEGEYVWEGTPGGSRTHYYARRLIKNYRLNQRLVDFLPSGATYTLLYADPSTVP